MQFCRLGNVLRWRGGLKRINIILPQNCSKLALHSTLGLDGMVLLWQKKVLLWQKKGNIFKLQQEQTEKIWRRWIGIGANVKIKIHGIAVSPANPSTCPTVDPPDYLPAFQFIRSPASNTHLWSSPAWTPFFTSNFYKSVTSAINFLKWFMCFHLLLGA